MTATPASKQYRVAIIGTGAIAGSHITALRAAGERVEIVAAVDVDEARSAEFAAKHNIPAHFASAAKMLEQVRPDLVHIATPPATHAPLIIDCLEASASVYCEKPLCASLAEFDQITKVEEHTGHFVSTVFQWRFGSAAQHLKRLIAAGELGKPLIGTCLTLWYRDLAYYAVPWRGKWATELGGPTLGHGIHLTDLFLWLFGEWTELSAMVGTLDRPIEVEDASMALVKFANGAMGSITNSILSPRQETYLRLDFQRGTAEMTGLYRANNANWRFSLPDAAQDTTALQAWARLSEDVTGSHDAQLAALLDSMDRGERPLVSGAEARRIIEFSASLYKSAMTGQPVRRGSLTPNDPFYHAMNGRKTPPSTPQSTH
jgi:predicted dehydrogenase